MSNPGEQRKLPLEKRRQQVIDLLCRHVAADSLTLEEFELRVDRAHRAGSLAEFDTILRDLPVIDGSEPAADTSPLSEPRPVHAQERVQHPIVRRESQVLTAIMSGTTRTGSWIPARRSTLVSVMGGIDLDFRDAILAPGVTEITAIAIMGGIEIIVPPDLVIDCDGVGIMGAFHYQSPALGIDPTKPILRIRGIALMGGVEIRVQLPGETAAEARRRIRAELREARRAKKKIARHSHGHGGY